MRKKIIASLVVSSLLTVKALTVPTIEGVESLPEEVERECYPNSGVVTEVNYVKDTITVTVFNGNTFTFPGTFDWAEGDIAALMLDNKGTRSVYDDTVVKACYSGWVY